MKIYISAKDIRKHGGQIAACPYIFEAEPATLRQLISMLVCDGVERYNRRLRDKDTANILTKEEMDSMSQVGKIGFGIPFGSREADAQDALDTAMQGFEDGLYRVFIEDLEIESLDAPLRLQEGDTITIIRLVMLTGGYF